MRLFCALLLGSSSVFWGNRCQWLKLAFVGDLPCGWCATSCAGINGVLGAFGRNGGAWLRFGCCAAVFLFQAA
ncbi:hypothetical protein [Alysiella crassa]|uniref:hypothetical protein n=1 Tax=Alysiella crassa TaxID=153491 RepID=UPI001FD105B8|nr:hypothetical protein [Alysiella crassa]UOP07556.1 hypothetical protein LVJ80_03945 [Alysiella crassa]